MGNIQVFDSQRHQFGTTERATVSQREHEPITNRRLGRYAKKVLPLFIGGNVRQLDEPRH